ncbi:hypothetical protein BCR32DRAFT_280591 [Anaeromyces robustus]|uniref:Uncharacterized protein n=1 Tax=Anaeromyces robustus TaxID=1754192 RepID=A0A1Y1X3D6_9FUNG|nr:hypothetical protein BCR32DRAFT_280591 [Anaeromyces robustus]|eukprot:ORX80321.1 hypothetical protein BCR32DRAFT_280591 [Anaeromyces robustus]
MMELPLHNTDRLYKINTNNNKIFYAETHPDHVRSLILREIFLLYEERRCAKAWTICKVFFNSAFRKR